MDTIKLCNDFSNELYKSHYDLLSDWAKVKVLELVVKKLQSRINYVDAKCDKIESKSHDAAFYNQR